jgi:pilus assembly protein CpaE
MGSYETPSELGAHMAVDALANVAIVANSADIAQLKLSVASNTLAGVQCVAAASDETVPATLLADLTLLIIEVDPNVPASVQRFDAARAARPDLAIIVALRDASVGIVRRLVRQGVSDIATLPFDLAELDAQILDAVARVRTEQSASVRLAPLVSIVRSTGGCGTTTLATHLAAALADGGENARPCLIDLDVQFGSVATSLGADPRASVVDMIEAGARLDADCPPSAPMAQI